MAQMEIRSKIDSNLKNLGNIKNKKSELSNNINHLEENTKILNRAALVKELSTETINDIKKIVADGDKKNELDSKTYNELTEQEKKLVWKLNDLVTNYLRETLEQSVIPYIEEKYPQFAGTTGAISDPYDEKSEVSMPLVLKDAPIPFEHVIRVQFSKFADNQRVSVLVGEIGRTKYSYGTILSEVEKTIRERLPGLMTEIIGYKAYEILVQENTNDKVKIQTYCGRKSSAGVITSYYNDKGKKKPPELIFEMDKSIDNFIVNGKEFEKLADALEHAVEFVVKANKQ